MIMVLVLTLTSGLLVSPTCADFPADLPADLGHDLAAWPTTENAWWLVGGAGLALTAYHIEDAEGVARALASGPWPTLADVGNTWGDARFQIPLALGTWAAGSWWDDGEVADTGYDLSRGLLMTYATTSLMKVVIDRERPNGGGHSFPSGHTAAAFTTAGVLMRRHGGWLGATSLVLAGLTGMGRMEDVKHWGSDVAAGATIGWIIGRTAARPGRHDKNAWLLLPTAGGLALAHKF